ncbi:MAG TPA: VWA domain-containing protein [Vicinamibacterales bacterium]|nr:VWA domain-containing protein [Vicinamibacterales bacterium]
MRQLALAVLVFASCLCAIDLTARQARPPQTPPAFRAAVDIVHLDVSVLDGNRRPVRGLTPADFTVLDNGVPQQISVFSAVDIPDAAAPSAPWMRDVAPDVGTNDALQDRRLFLIIIDDATIQADLRAQQNIRTISTRMIDRLGPSDLAAVIFTRDNRHSQDFTADRSRLLAAAGKFTGGFRDLGGVAGGDDLYFMYSVNVLESAIDLLSKLPDRRKSIVYIGQGVPVDAGFLAPQIPGLPVDGGSSSIMTSAMMGRMTTQMRKAFDRAARANVNVYTVDACGLRAPAPAARYGTRLPTCVPGLEVEYLQTLAENTGARAVINTNEFEPGLSAIFDENASYYLLGFQQPPDAKPGSLRRLEVRVRRPDVIVRTRNGYETAKADVARRAAESPLGAALAGVLPKADLPLQLSAVPVQLPNKRESALAIVVGVRQPIREVGARHVENVDLQVSAFNVEGKSFGSTRLKADVTLRAGATGLAEYEVLSRLDLRPGRYQLRIAAHIGSLSTGGSLYYDVDVPDVSKTPIALSGLIVSASPRPVVAPVGALASILPVVPTTRRAFLATDRVTAFTRVHQSGKTPVAPVQIRLAVRNASNVQVAERLHVVDPAQFNSARAADVVLDVPVARLQPGPYLLTLETTAGTTTVRRQSRFEILRSY